jgi:glycosyltransferase involved in cell wall biosynthesis
MGGAGQTSCERGTEAQGLMEAPVVPQLSVVPTRVSAIIATYNWPQALDLVLDGFMRQTWPNLEIVVADDGSSEQTRALVERYQRKSPFPIVHSWQEDDGYRLARSRNLAVSRSSGDYLIMLDGDGLVFPTFVEKHMRYAEPGWFTAGRRCFMKAWSTRHVLARHRHIHLWPRSLLFALSLVGGSNRPFQLLSLPYSDRARRARASEWNKAQTCNMGIWRNDFLRIGGFEEDFTTYGLEDTDFVLRLLRSGVKRLSLEHADPVLHLFHGRRKISNENRLMLEEIMTSTRTLPLQSLLCERPAS